MRLLELSLLASVLIVNASNIHSSCLTKGDASGNKRVNIYSLSDGIALYTLKQYKEMVKDSSLKSKNILISPYSIWSALALTYLGARGTSSNVLGNLLGINGMNKTKVEENMNLLTDKISSSTKGNIFKMANKISVEKTTNLKSCVAADPSVPVSKANFKSNPEGERLKLNEWAKSNTDGLIKNLLPSGSITPDTILTILNAVYFKGEWKTQFQKARTHESIFYGFGKETKAKMMYRSGKMYNGEDQTTGASYVDLPYQDDKYSMLAILPSRQNPDIDAVIGKLTLDTVKSFWENLWPTQIILGFPKFEIKESYSLKKSLSKIGALQIFRNINLSGMLNPLLPIKVSDVFHKSFIKVDEEGTEAAAATGIMVATYQAAAPTFKYLYFNRPFAFILREKHTNTILFMGVVRSL